MTKNLPDKPDKTAILKLIAESPAPLSKRDIAQAFGIKGDDRRDIKDALRELEEEGQIVKTRGKEYTIPKGLPSVAVVEVYEIDIDGDVFARPTEWNIETQGPPPRIEIVPDGNKGHAALKEKDRALVSLRRFSDKLYEGKVIKKLDDPRGQVMGQIIRQKNAFVLSPASKRAKHDFDVPQADLNGAIEGDLVVGEIQPSRGLQRKKVRITQVIGRRDDPKAISLIALYEAGLSENFPQDVIDETEGMSVPELKGREDLRQYPLVTIDGADARDFDDAVFAEREENGDYHLIVAIADVAYYVRPNSALDREAYRRGNSTYFPDRVVPMLPEALSNDLCSLRPKENRACMAFHMRIDTSGGLKSYKIVRGLMRSEARLTYDQVQAAKDGEPSELTGPLMQKVINPLYEVFEILDKARRNRGALDLDLPERQILIDKDGNMTGVKNRARYDSHKLIEEFMILANVAAAQALEQRKAPCVYRIHDRPSQEKLNSASEFLEAFGLSIPKGITIKPAQLNLLLTKAKESPYSHLVSEVILRSQSQAIYHPENIGHFGLALQRYAHFTSPIRRYADLLVHRSLIKAYDLGPGGLSEEEAVTLEERAEHISQTERTSAEAERSSIDRFTAKWMSQRIGEQFAGRINGVTRFGLFVTLEENGADGLIPIRTLPTDYYVHDEKQHALVGQRSGRLFRLGAKVNVRIVEADGFTGSSLFELVGTEGADLTGVKFKNSNNALQSRKNRPNHNTSKDRRDRPGKKFKNKKGGRKRR
ncbi:MAG: ribonuclease R [Micavibrio aeruginosavorus]|uniref:Ribonuclease R n=1 Tax=Micavibrio aeruginosavorus TaxID=349221 RepID=A0A2W5N1Z9_9BACT|nr:MAG: ribonuclease R [Micavibrio aeruginosavorus]